MYRVFVPLALVAVTAIPAIAQDASARTVQYPHTGYCPNPRQTQIYDTDRVSRRSSSRFAHFHCETTRETCATSRSRTQGA